MPLVPGLVLFCYATWYLVAEVRLRRRSRMARGVLDSFRWQVLLPPVLIYLIAAVVLSVGSWSILGLTAFLIVPVLPAVIGMSWLALDPDRPLGQGLALAGGLGVLGVVAVGVGR